MNQQQANQQSKNDQYIKEKENMIEDLKVQNQKLQKQVQNVEQQLKEIDIVKIKYDLNQQIRQQKEKEQELLQQIEQLQKKIQKDQSAEVKLAQCTLKSAIIKGTSQQVQGEFEGNQQDSSSVDKLIGVSQFLNKIILKNQKNCQQYGMKDYSSTSENIPENQENLWKYIQEQCNCLLNLASQFQQFEEDLQTLNNATFQALSQNKPVKVKVIELEKQKQTFIQSIQQDKDKLIQQIKGLEDKILQLQDQISNNEKELTQIQALKLQLEENKKQIQKYVDEQQKFEATIQTQESKNKELQQIIQNHQSNELQFQQQLKNFQTSTKELETARSENSQLQNKISELKSQIESLQKELGQYKEESSKLQEQVKLLNEQIQLKQNQSEKDLANLKQLQSQLEDKQKTEKLYQEDKERLDKLNQTLEIQSKELQQNIQNLEGQKIENEKLIKEKTNQIQELEKSNKLLKDQNASKEEEIQSKQKQINQQNEAQKQQQDILQKQYQEALKQKEDLHATLKEKLIELESLKQTNLSLKILNDENQKKCKDHLNQLSELQQNQQQVKLQNENILKLQSQIKEMEQQILKTTEQDKEIEILKVELQNKSLQLDDSNKKIEEFSKGLEIQVQKYVNENNELKIQIQTLVQQLKESQTQQEDLEEQIRKLQEQLKQLNESFDIIVDDLDFFESQAAQKEETIKENERRITVLECLQGVAQEVDELRIENTILRQKLGGEMPDEKMIDQINTLSLENKELQKKHLEESQKIEELQMEIKQFLEDKAKIQQYNDLWEGRQKDQILIRRLKLKVRQLEENLPSGQQNRRQELKNVSGLEEMIQLEKQQALLENILLEPLKNNQQEQPMDHQNVYDISEKCLEQKFEEDQQDVSATQELNHFSQFLLDFFIAQSGTISLAYKSVAQYLLGLKTLCSQNDGYSILIARVLQVFDQDPFDKNLSNFLIKVNKLFINVQRQYKERIEELSEEQKQSSYIQVFQSQNYNGGYISCIDAFNLIFNIFQEEFNVCNLVLHQLGENLKNQERGSQTEKQEQSLENQQKQQSNFNLMIICWKLCKFGQSPKDVFYSLDKEVKGELEKEQFAKLIQEQLKPWITKEECTILVDFVKDKREIITFENFVSQINFISAKLRGKNAYLVSKYQFLNAFAMVYQSKKTSDYNLLKQMFVESNLNKSGLVELNDFQNFILKIDQKCSKQKIIEIFQQSVEKSNLTNPDAISAEAFSMIALKNGLGGFGVQLFSKFIQQNSNNLVSKISKREFKLK